MLNPEGLLCNEGCPDGRPSSPWKAGRARRERLQTVARLSCRAIKACCMQIPAADALSSWLLLDSLFISFPNKPVSPLLFPGLFFGLTGPTPTLNLDWAAVWLHRWTKSQRQSKERWKGGRSSWRDFSATQRLTKPMMIGPLGVCDANSWQGPRRAVPVGTPCALLTAGSKKSARWIWGDLAAFGWGLQTTQSSFFWSRELLAPPCGLCPRWRAGHALCDPCLAARQWVADQLGLAWSFQNSQGLEETLNS